jgi:GNAT superfamily N-acetyltransferase
MAARRLDAIADLYDQAYADPPYRGEPLFSRARFLERTGRQRTNPGFTLITADADDVLAGFAFGFTFAAGRWWGGTTTPPPPDALVAAPKFAVIELVVGKPWRGRGLARRMIDQLLRDRPEPYAILLAEPDAPARRIYARWGWQHVADVRPADDAPPMHALSLPLGGPP